MIEVKTDKEDGEWFKWFKVFGMGLMGGFAAGLIAANISYTKNLLDDCETMKQFRVGKLAYTCMVK
jgi:hypothetical protein